MQIIWTCWDRRRFIWEIELLGYENFNLSDLGKKRCISSGCCCINAYVPF